MKILVIGGGGREHALVWKLRQGNGVHQITCVPGNGGITGEAECVAADVGDVWALVALAEKMKPDLTVVGPELPLVNGLADEFRRRGWAVVGPSAQAAKLEGSKIFAKEFLLRHKIPTAGMYGAFNDVATAYRALGGVKWPLVVKADGLCAGKGVLVTSDENEARDFLERVLEKKELGEGGSRVMFEEGISGEELSFILLTDGKRSAALVPTRDHKRAFDHDHGPNTGGMGAYSTDELLPDGMRQEIMKAIVEPTMKGLAADGIFYQGFLYIGLMLTKDGPMVLEFNCRLGDPETQAIVARMDFDLAEVLADAAAGKLNPEKLKWQKGASACVVLTSGGYPGKFENGKEIHGLEAAGKVADVKVLHAGTKRVGEKIVTNGGRVLGVTATGDSLATALKNAYEAVGKIQFEGMHYRKDIGMIGMQSSAAGN